MEKRIESTPCGPGEPCNIDCDSDDDITDKDLMALLNHLNQDTFEPGDELELVNEDTVAALQTSKKSKERKENKERKESKGGKGGKERKEDEERETTRKVEKNEGNAEKEGRKKRPCRKFIKNPFFTNRLKFSTDLPPRPPLPPPQFFPLADEGSKPKVCQKKKKCKKKNKPKPEYDTDGYSKISDKEEEEEKEEEKVEAEEREEEKVEVEEKEVKVEVKEEEKGEEEKEKEEEEEREEENVEVEEKEVEVEKEEEVKKEEEFNGRPLENKSEVEQEGRARKHCKKAKDKGYSSCRKKVSESSIPPQPRRIPALMKDLPLTCPKDIPEVERQIRMSHDKSFQSRACQKKCKKKYTFQQLIS